MSTQREPYYQDEHVTLYHGDCLELADLWTVADVLVTDPPYGTAGGDKRGNDGYGRRKGNQRGAERAGQHIANDSTTEARDNSLAAWGNGPAIVFGSPRLPDPPGIWDDRLVWNKTRPGTNGGPFRYMHESIYARGMVRANASTFSVFSIYPDQADHIHAKPIELMEALVATCPPGQIADPFAGSGSTLVAARNLGRKAVGVELEEAYCELIAKRLQQGAFNFEELTA